MDAQYLKVVFTDDEDTAGHVVVYVQPDDQMDYQVVGNLSTISRACRLFLGTGWQNEYRLECRGAAYWRLLDDTGSVSHSLQVSVLGMMEGESVVRRRVEPCSGDLGVHLTRHTQYSSFVWKFGMDHIEVCEEGYQEQVSDTIPMVAHSTEFVSIVLARFEDNVQRYVDAKGWD